MLAERINTNTAPKGAKPSTTTKHKIGKITYLVVSAASETATDTAKQKIEKLIMRECDRLNN